MRGTILIVASCLLMLASAQNSCTWTNEQKWTGWNFYDQFDFFTEPDQTHGHVTFQDRASATNAGLISVNEKGQIYMGVDYTHVQPQGRDALRIHSKTTFTEGLVILDLDHMPGSICGTWPAFWTRSDITGEIDIIEGVNKKNQNQMTLHTDITKCQMGGARSQSGYAQGLNCDSTDTKWAGCAVMSNKAGSYGDSFNAAGGGAYVMERSATAIKMWHFPKGQYPADLLSGSPNTCNFGTPDAHFPLLDNCPPVNFAAQRIIFDITFCGDWAGNDYAPCGGGMDTCKNYVTNNPSAFKDAYWLINSLRLFVRDPKGNNTYTPAPSATTGNSNTPVTSNTPTTNSNTCSDMFNNLKCRTTAQDPAQMDNGKLGSTRSWLCNNYPQFCGAVNYGGQYSTCNAAEQMSYAMNEYYKVYGAAQGDSACAFGGLGKVISSLTPVTSQSPATSASSASYTCQKSSSCDAKLCACGSACYAPDQYCCVSGQLTQIGNCPKTNTPASSTTSNNAATPSTTATPATMPLATSSCTNMYNALTCRTASQDISKLDAGKLGGSRAWLCNNYPQFCGAVNYGGQYSTCNAAEQMSYAMNEYYKAYGAAQGASACDFGGVGQVIGQIQQSPCSAMFSALKCRTKSQDSAALDANKLSSARSWLCSSYPTYCSAINYGAQFSGCGAAEQLSYAMNQYYLAYQNQGSSACDFGGIGQVQA